MLSSTRRGAQALRAFRIASFQSLTTPLNHSLQPQPFALRPAYLQRVSKPFSSISRRFQQATQVDEIVEDAPPEVTKFEELAQAGTIHPLIVDTITREMKIDTMTEVQRMTLNHCLDGADVIAQARTGTGKTIAFLLPIIQRILRSNPELSQKQGRNAKVDIKGLIISPTRELAEQIAVEARKLVKNTGIQVATAVGGTQKSYHLQSMQRHGCHLLVGTPGRVNDILGDRRAGVQMDNLETFVLDEADRLLDIGFAPAIDEIQSHMPDRKVKDRQTLMFSATVPKSVVTLVRQTMRPNFKFIRTVDPDEAPTHERVPQMVVFLEGLQNQAPTILEIALNAIEAHKRDPLNNLPFKAIVYYGSTNEVTVAHSIFSNLQDPSNASGRGRFAPHPLAPTQIFQMNGKLDQRVRTRESEAFRKAESAMLFSSDVTARGMDFPNVSHVIQIGLPKNADDYIHRLGRTGRAGKQGEGWLLLNKDEYSAFRRKMAHPGLKVDETTLPTASLDMTKPAQLAANVAKMLQMVEHGVKTVPFRIKSAAYQSLLGVLPQQFPDRQRQDQINMMNNLARYGWGMQTPPQLPKNLVNKLGYGNCSGIEYETDSYRENRHSSRGRDQPRRSSFDDKDPFGMGQSGKGVFGGSGERGGGFGRREGGNGYERRDTGNSYGRRDSGRSSFGGGRREGGYERRGGSRR